MTRRRVDTQRIVQAASTPLPRGIRLSPIVQSDSRSFPIPGKSIETCVKRR